MLKELIKNRFKEAIEKETEWENKRAISLVVYSNGAYTWENYSNLTTVDMHILDEIPSQSIEERREEDFLHELWNQSCYNMGEIEIVSRDDFDAEVAWLNSIGVDDIGSETGNDYNDTGAYVGKGPNGYLEMVCLVSEIIQELYHENYLKEVLGKDLTIVIDDYESTWYLYQFNQLLSKDKDLEDYNAYINSVYEGSQDTDYPKLIGIKNYRPIFE